MTREIKFRVWDLKDKKYLLPEKQGFVILPTAPSFGVTLPYENCSNPGNIDEDCIDWADADLLMGRYELEQFAGLKDKNGKEIYEGDIVKQTYSNLVYPVRFEYGGFLPFTSDMFTFDNDYCEVIGNIHEDKELL